MCGIAGFCDLNKKTPPSVISSMIGQIDYRGPDSFGKYISQDDIVGLGINRLSIIDLKGGNQPIKNEDGSVVVVYNGEIYNYQKIKKDLEKKGHKFRTKSDTEILVHLYEEKGDSFVKHLNGMFAFALWDEKKEKLLLGRDRAGIKPLYYFQRGNVLAFGSEVKTILKHPAYKKDIDEKGMSSYFYFGFTTGETTVFKDIKKLLPGHILVFSKKGLEIKKYYEIPIRQKTNPELDGLLEKAVISQLQADVPVGVFLSGGLDSSLIASYISKHQNLKSFSIGFEDDKYDESVHARYVSKRLGTKHYNETFTVGDALRIMDIVSNKLDEPFADASLLPTFRVNELAKKHVKVVLSGDGGDELFGGYPTYQAGIIADLLEFVPKNVINKASSFIDLIPSSFYDILPLSFKDYSKKNLAKIVAKGMQKDHFERHLYWMRTFFLGDINLYQKPDLSDLKDLLPKGVEKINNPALLGQTIDYYTYLRDDFFFKVDRASMYNSIEVRVPFLDNDIINYAFTTDRPHVNLLKTKIQLRELLVDKLPDVAKRPKKGFGIPLEKWLQTDMKDMAYSMITSKKVYNYIDKEKIKGVWDDHQKGTANFSGTIWVLVMFSAWLNNYYAKN